MFFRVRTTLILPDSLVRALKRRAADRGTTLSAVVAEALRRGLEAEPAEALPPLPTYALGVPRVDLADRKALHDLMDQG